MKSILIVKTSAIGDLVHTFPVLEYLRKRFPDAQIDWVVERGGHSLIAAHPLLNQALCIDTKEWRRSPLKSWNEMRTFFQKLASKEYDLLIDLQGNCKSGLITWRARAKTKIGFGFKSVAEKPNCLVTNMRYNPPSTLSVRARNLNLVQSHLQDKENFLSSGTVLKISEEERKRLQEWVKKAKHTRARSLMVCFGSKWPNKQLKEESLKALLERINSKLRPFFFFISGSSEEKRVADELASLFPEASLSVDKLSLPLWQALMSETSGVLAVDSAALHICGTTSTPSFSVFGPSSSTYYKPDGEKHVAIQGSCPYKRTFEKRCPILRSCKTASCIRDLEADALFTPFLAWWQAHVL